MKALFGAVLIIAGVMLGVYVGLWVCFIGGIVDIIQAVRAPELVTSAVAWGVIKILFSGLAGWISGVVLAGPGYVILND